MALAIQLFSYLVWFPLKILGISALLRAGVGRYPLIFTFMIVTFLFAAVEAPVALAYYWFGHGNSEWFKVVHWIAEGLTYPLILAVVISLIHRATAKLLPRRIIRAGLVVGGLLFITISFFVHYTSAGLGLWMTPWTRDLNVCAAILDLALWGLLISSRERDSTLLLLAGGMGIKFTGEAIGTSVRNLGQLSRSFPLFMFGHVLVMLADAAYLYIWWQTFRKEALNRPHEQAASGHAALGTGMKEGSA